MPPSSTPPIQKPNWLPEAHYDATTGPKWDDFGKHYSELATRDAAEQVRRGSLPQKPEDYKIGTTENFKPPEGVEWKVDEANPLWSQARVWAQKHGLTQDAFHEAVDLFAGSQVADQQSINTAKAAEIAKLGTAGSSRVTAINTWIDAMGVPGLKGRIFTAQDVQDWEKVITKHSSQNAAPFSQAHREPSGAPGKVTEEQFQSMSAAERLDYVRSHNPTAH